jgi:hypothetical protein
MYSDNIGVLEGQGPIKGIIYDPVHKWIACICKKSTQLWRIRGTELVPILQTLLVSEGYGKCVHFWDDGASVVIYYLNTHEW